MDVILEIADTLFLDRLYSKLLPASPAQYLHYKLNDVANTTLSNIGQAVTGGPQYDYIYEPASQFLSLEPTQWTYSSSWPRDNIYRQAISLFTIVW